MKLATHTEQALMPTYLHTFHQTVQLAFFQRLLENRNERNLPCTFHSTKGVNVCKRGAIPESIIQRHTFVQVSGRPTTARQYKSRIISTIRNRRIGVLSSEFLNVIFSTARDDENEKNVISEFYD